MDVQKFEGILRDQFAHCEDILVTKAKEYATEDRLHNFKVAAAMQKTTPQNALAGMLAKHTVSIYDMCRSDKTYPIEMWSEKITDHINYLVLLMAVVAENETIFIDDKKNDSSLLEMTIGGGCNIGYGRVTVYNSFKQVPTSAFDGFNPCNCCINKGKSICATCVGSKK